MSRSGHWCRSGGRICRRGEGDGLLLWKMAGLLYEQLY